MKMAKLDIAKLAERLAQLNKNNGEATGTSMNFLTINDGRNLVRILPPREGADMFYEEAWVHYGVGKSKDNKGTMVVCPTTAKEGAKCPMCELSKEFKRLSKKKDDSYDKQAKGVYRKKRVYYNAIDRNEDLSVYEYKTEGEESKWVNTKTGEDESPVKVWGSGVGIFKSILALIVDPEYGDVTDAEEGLDLIVVKTGSGQFNTEYGVTTVRKETPVGFDGWETAMNDLSTLIVPKTYDEIAGLMEGKEVDEEEEESTQEEVDKALDNLPTKEEEAEDDELGDEIKAALAKRKAGK